jgi:hypothetical protein
MGFITTSPLTKLIAKGNFGHMDSASNYDILDISICELESVQTFSPDLSEAEIKDILEGDAEIKLGKAKKFTNVEDAIAWLRSSEG